MRHPAKSPARGAHPTGTNKPPRDSLYAEVTDRIVAEMEAGRVPWVQPWSSGACTAGLPRNALSGRPYSGINILLLWGATFQHGYPGQGWLTFRQALEAGGAVRKGEHGTAARDQFDLFQPKGTHP